MLIVNADDFGAARSATDPVLAAHEEGLLSSASLMVWMADSHRAARLAGERGLSLGLHLNLTLPFTAREVSGPARALQAGLTRAFDRGRLVADPSPELEQQLREAVSAQLGEFRALHGEPAHINGHHHVHLQASVLACLPPAVPLRPPPRHPAELNRRSPRGERQRLRRFTSPDACIGFRQLHPAFSGASGLGVLELARRQALEVVVHPQQADERAALHGAQWRAAIAPLRLGSYRDLPAS
jgi:hypothetical protein